MIVYVMILSCSDYFIVGSDFLLFALIFYYPIFSHYPISDSEGERHLREENLSNSLHISTLWGHVYIQ